MGLSDGPSRRRPPSPPDPGNHPPIEPESDPDEDPDDGPDDDGAGAELEGSENPKKAYESALEAENASKLREHTARIGHAVVRIANELDRRRRERTRDKQKSKGKAHYPYAPIVAHVSMAARLARKAYKQTGGKKTSFAARSHASALIYAAAKKSVTYLPEDMDVIIHLLKLLGIPYRKVAKMTPTKFAKLVNTEYGKLRGTAKLQANKDIDYLQEHLSLRPTANHDAFSQL